ncbi:MAG: ABC transporter permease subunit [Phycisphaerae bacterium]
MTPKPIRLSQLKYHWPIYFFALPALLLIALFQYYPAATGIYHSFYRWNGADINEFVGLGNYRALLRDSDFWRSFRVALVIGMWNVVKMIPALMVAVCIHRCRSMKLQYYYRVLFVAPMVIPGLVVVLIWRSLFFEALSGYLNRFLISTGLVNVLVWADTTFHWGGIFQTGDKPAWLGDGRLILAACIMWGFPWVGSFAVLTHLAKLQGIPRELYEACDLDGCNWWTRFTKLELPMIMGSINILLVFLIIDTIKDAGMILALAGMEGGPGGVVTVPALFMLRKAFIDQQMGAACAVGIVLTVIVMTLQKLLGNFTDWDNISQARKTLARLSGLLAAFLLYWYLQTTAIALLIALLVCPWGLFKITWRRVLGIATTTRHGDPWAITEVQLHKQAAREQRLRSRFYQFHLFATDRLLRACKHSFIWFVLATAYLPLYLMLIVSLKNNIQYYNAPAVITYPLHFENWQTAWEAVIPALANSIFITTASTVLTLLLALSAAYFFARVKVPGSTLLWNALLLLMMMPTIANLVPLFRLLISLNLVNTLTALVAVGAAGGQVFAIFMLRNFVADLPQDLFEAAEIDGASHLRQMFTIVAPLSGPILGVVGIMHAIGQWNDFVLPLIVMRDHARLPVMVQLLRMAGEYIKLWGPLMAGYALASIPIIILFVVSMRLFTRGLTEGAVKG